MPKQMKIPKRRDKSLAATDYVEDFLYWLGERIDVMKSALQGVPRNIPVVATLIALSNPRKVAMLASRMLPLVRSGRRDEAVRLSHAEADRMIAEAIRQATPIGGELACRKGCCFCCTQPVSTHHDEVGVISGYLRRTLDGDQMGDLRRRMTQYRNRVALGTEERPVVSMCPLNVGGECTIYEVRPLTCRGYNSYDSDACSRCSDEAYAGPTMIRSNPQANGAAATAHVALISVKSYQDNKLPPSVDLIEALDHDLTARN